MRRHRADGGFTLIEVIISLVLSTMLGAVVVTALITSLNVADSTTAQVNDSTDAGLISAFLIRDAQSAGSINPSDATPDSSLGVSTDPADGDGRVCAPATSTLTLRLSWMARTATASTKYIVAYATSPDPLDPAKLQLTRRQCTDNSGTLDHVDNVLGHSIKTAAATCAPASAYCAGLPDTVSLAISGFSQRAPFAYTLTAALRTAGTQLTIIGPTSLPDGQIGTTYASNVVTTIGAAGTSTWSATGLPPGLAIDESSGIIGGTPTLAGTWSSVVVTVTDQAGATATRSYTIVIHAPPVANGDNIAAFNEDAVLTIVAPGVLGNDSSPEGKPMSAVLYAGAANGFVTLAPNGGFTYTPNANFSGADSFVYKATDGTLESAPVTVNLTINPVDDPPVNQVPVGQETMINVPKVFSRASNRVSVSDVDAGGSAVKVTVTSTSGTVSVTAAAGTNTLVLTDTVANVNANLRNLKFTPAAGFTGAASVTITTTDQGATGSGGPLTDVDSIPVNVTSIGLFTSKKDVGDVEFAGSSTYASSAYNVAGSGWDIWENNDGFQYLYRQLTGDGSLTARVASVLVTYSGTRNATKTCWSPGGTQYCESVAKAEVMIRQDVSTNAAVHGSAGMTQGNGSEFIFRSTNGATSGASGAKDSLDPPYWVRLTRRGNQFTAEISADGITWVPRGTPQTIAMNSTVYIGLAASAVNQLSGDDPAHKLNTATFDNVSISTPPVAVADAYLVNEDSTLTLDAGSGVLANDSDPEGDNLTVNLVSGTTGLTLNGDGSFTYTPPLNYVGVASFSYTADDGILESVPVTVTLTVNGSNETPSFVKGPDQIVSSSAAFQAVPGWATAINAGTGETGQLIDFIVTNTNQGLFSVQPAVRPDGTLTFAPIGGTSGQATVSVKVHDNGGTANSGTDTSAVQTFTIVADDPPTVTTTSTGLTYTENATTAVDPGVTVRDVDNANLSSATVRISSGYQNSEDSLAFSAQNGITGSFNPASGVLTLTGTSSVANYQVALRSVTYTNSSHNPSTTSRTVSFVANDGLMASASAARTITVTLVNDTPVVTTSAGSMAYTEDATSPLDSGVTVTDVDSTTLASATLSVSGGYVSGQDTLGFTSQNGISGSWNASTGVLTLTGTTSVANYQTALRSVTYTNSSHNPSTAARTVTLTANDGQANSNAATRSIAITTVDDAPVMTTTGTSLAYTENTVAVVDSGVTATDVDNTSLASATVSITAGYVNGQDSLGFTNQSGITGSWNASTGVLTLSGSSSSANYQTALRSVTYSTGDNPTSTSRTVTFMVNDGQLNSNAATRSITVTTVNDAPVVTTSGGSMAYTENATSPVDSGLTVIDADSATIASATASITGNYLSGQDSLGFTTQNGITGSWNSSTGVLTLSGSTSVASYQTALRSVTYTNSSHLPSTVTRTVTFVVNDGSLASTAATRTIAVTSVDDPPVVTTTGSTVANTENVASVIDSGVTVSDVDDTNLVSATVSITGGFVVGQDTLAFTNANGISGSWNVSTGVLTLTGSSSLANYQASLRTVTYTAGDNPTNPTRTITFIVNDGQLNSSAATKAINVTAVNDAPVVTTTGGSMAYTENATSAVDSGVTILDDSANVASAMVSISGNYLSAQDTLAFTNQNNITGSWNASTGVLTLSGSSSVANYQTALRSITYRNSSHTPTTTTRTVSFTVNDGSLASSAATRTIAITAVNDAPVNGVPGAQTITRSGTLTFSNLYGNLISISDLDAGSSTVQVQLSVASGKLTLSRTTNLSITAGANGTNTMTFTGTITNINAALAGMTFKPSGVAGSLPIQIVTNDFGNTGSGGQLTDTDTISVTST